MEGEEPKEWDPHCAKCQEELQRLIELSQSVYDDIDHGAGLYRLPLPACTHRGVPREGGSGEGVP